MAVTAIWRIRDGGTSYQPGEIVPGLSAEQEAELVRRGHASVVGGVAESRGQRAEIAAATGSPTHKALDAEAQELGIDGLKGWAKMTIEDKLDVIASVKDGTAAIEERRKELQALDPAGLTAAAEEAGVEGIVEMTPEELVEAVIVAETSEASAEGDELPEGVDSELGGG